MTDTKKFEKRDSEIRHHKQFWWQIMLPILIALIIVLVILVMTVLAMDKTPEINENWANISAIFLSLPAILLSLAILGIVILFAWLIRKLYKFIPPYSGMAANSMKKVNQFTNNSTEKILIPFVKGSAYMAGFKKLLSMAFHLSSDQKE
jgi:uncharacterized protein involved in cysteine biosynthesis